MAGNREYKSDVFSMLMEDKGNALEYIRAPVHRMSQHADAEPYLFFGHTEKADRKPQHIRQKSGEDTDTEVCRFL